MRTVTLNLGLRYEGEGGFSEPFNRLSDFDPTLTNPLTNTPGAILYASPSDNTLQNNHFGLFAPRIGVAWNPKPSVVVRAGYGVYYVPISAQQNFSSTPPGYAISYSQVVANPSSPMPFMELDTGAPAYTVPTAANRTPAISNGQSISYFPPNAPQAYMQEWQVGIQKQLGTSWVTEISYVGSKGTHLLYPRDSNQVPQADFKPGALQSYRPFPQYQTITTYFDDAISDYLSLIHI